MGNLILLKQRHAQKQSVSKNMHIFPQLGFICYIYLIQFTSASIELYECNIYGNATRKDDTHKQSNRI